MELQNDLIIPGAVQIALDDTGWFCPTDDRKNGGPSRSGMPRYHEHRDYEAIERLGKALRMEINCGFVIGEWDLENSLKRLPWFSKYGDNWDNASHRDPAELERCADVINASPHIDFAIHGLMHGYYLPESDNRDESDYFYHVQKKLYRVSEQEIRNKLDAFLELARKSGIRKTINTFIPPSFTFRKKDLTGILKDYGIDVVSTIFATMYAEGELGPERAPCTEKYAFAENGIAVADRHYNPIPWDACEGDFTQLKFTDGIVGLHWPNILHRDPERNSEIVDRAAWYFLKLGEQFGAVLSPNMHFCAAQSLFRRFARCSAEEGCAVFDWSAVPAIRAVESPVFVLSAKAPIVPAFGCTLERTDRHAGFTNYWLRPTGRIFGVRAEEA